MEVLVFALAKVCPIFFMIIIGLILKQTRIIGETFVKESSNIVFKVAMPVMIFQKMSQIETIPSALYQGIIIFAVVTTLIVIFSWIFSYQLEGPKRSTFVQGAFRSNIAIIGFAVTEKSFGYEALQVGAVLLAVIMPLYNLFAIILLSRGSSDESQNIFKEVAIKVVKNPLIWGVILGLPIGIFHISIPMFAFDTMSYLSQLTLPLALIGIGASLELKDLDSSKVIWMGASAIKLIVLPAVVLGVSWRFGIRGVVLASMVITAGSPTAVASFVMARTMGGDGKIAGEIVSFTTLFSIVTFTFWISILRVLGS
ncbi:AEC family transporter [Spirochaeta cellobiosiphila]|uniref:AEC family transporter n=1 Tax=Spirochaeta cellobiosiphila TaxID=504483 RepID=UPI000408FC6C|nr:AEC family transporter [Spirochaeta cellobiosiphila]